MNDTELLALDLCEASAAIRTGAIDPRELTEAYLRRIEETEPRVNAYVTVDADGARLAAKKAADECEAGQHRGPLHGIPVGVKDIFDTAGLRTTYGSARYREHVPTADALVVGRLRSAGAVILGKHATHEFAWGGRTDNPHYGPTRNPRDESRIPGGSSGGGAASIVARSSLLAVGTDTAGSVRIPAALSGCVGFKPARDWVAMTGAFPLSPALDHVGVLTRTPADAAIAVSAISDLPCVVPAERRPLRVGLLAGASADVADDVVSAGVANAIAVLERSDFEVKHIDVPAVSERAEALLTLIKADAEMIHRSAYSAAADYYGTDLAALLGGPQVTADERENAQSLANDAGDALRRALGEVDVLMSATVPMVAPPIGTMEIELAGDVWPIEFLLTRLTSIANALGIPAISVPGAAESKLPVGIQFIARPDNTAELLAAAEAVSVGTRAGDEKRCS